jgi:hypothetical protein
VVNFGPQHLPNKCEALISTLTTIEKTLKQPTSKTEKRQNKKRILCLIGKKIILSDTILTSCLA